MAYQGLPRQTVDFLAGLAAEPTKPWFDAHRDDYERYWKAAGLDLVEALGPYCSRTVPRIEALPRVGGSLRRINRDVRFSADKTPYAPMLHLAFTVAAGPKHRGVHLVIQPQSLDFGAGEYGLPPAALEHFRRRVCNEAERAELLRAAAEIEALGGQWDAPDLKRVPQGFDAAPDWDHLLRRKSVILRGSMPLPDWLFTPDALWHLEAILDAHLPLLGWLGAQERP
ncbi:MAG: hypothetical protein RLZZ528_2477 [Pseudomonadota bacterium]|jgi:uncharacterized protein (TIGR02453 family)